MFLFDLTLHGWGNEPLLCFALFRFDDLFRSCFVNFVESNLPFLSFFAFFDGFDVGGRSAQIICRPIESRSRSSHACPPLINLWVHKNHY